MANESNEAQAQESEKQVYTLEQIAELRPIALVPEYLKANDIGKLEETLATFYKKIGIKDKIYIDDAVKSLLEVPSGLQAFMKNFSGRYNVALHTQKLKDLRQLYDHIFKETFDENDLQKADILFNSEETYQSILEKYVKVAEKAENKAKNFSEEEQKKAEKELEYLSRIVIPLKDSEDYELDKLRKPVSNEDRKKRWHTLYETKKEDKKGE